MHDHPDNLKQCLEYLITSTEGLRRQLKREGKQIKYSDAVVAAIAMLQEDLSAN